MSSTVPPPAGDTSPPQQRFFALQHLLSLTSEHLLTLPDGVIALLALQRSSTAGYRAATPVLYRTLTLRTPRSLHSTLSAFYRAVMKSVPAGGSGGIFAGQKLVEDAEADERWSFAQQVLDGEGEDMNGGAMWVGVRRSAWALGFVERLVIEDMDFGKGAYELAGELDLDSGDDLPRVASDAYAALSGTRVLILKLFPFAPLFRSLREFVLAPAFIVRCSVQDSYPLWYNAVGRLLAMATPRVLTVQLPKLTSRYDEFDDGPSLSYEDENVRLWAWRWVSDWKNLFPRIGSSWPGEEVTLRVYGFTLGDLGHLSEDIVARMHRGRLELHLDDGPMVVFERQDVGEGKENEEGRSRQR
ncbi:hypothetical protein IAT38_006052 [Cryptococcus sp. DSM 104549]